MVTKFDFLQDFFGFSKNGQKKCPKLKTQNTFGKRKSLKYNKFPKQHNITIILLSYCNIIYGLNEIRTHDTAFKVPCANRYTIRPELS